MRKTSVYISCPECKMIYVVSQQLCDTPQAGRFNCEDCGQPVHLWRGRYNFSDWKRVTA